MINKNRMFLVVISSLLIVLVSCSNRNVYDELPSNEDLTVAYGKLLKHNKLDRDSSNSFLDVGASFIIYPNNEVEKNLASVYITVCKDEGEAYKYIYNMTTETYDSYKVNSLDSLTKCFSNLQFSSFDILDVVRTGLLAKEGMNKPQISNIRFYINASFNKPEVETTIEDVDFPGNSRTFISDLEANIIQ